jgi:hypothetical protein
LREHVALTEKGYTVAVCYGRFAITLHPRVVPGRIGPDGRTSPESRPRDPAQFAVDANGLKNSERGGAAAARTVTAAPLYSARTILFFT